MNKKGFLAVAIVFTVLLIDQVSKIIIKTSMRLEESFAVFGNWFYIHFTENPGMAMGMEWGGVAGKYALTSFRIVAIFGISYYIYTLIKNKAHTGFVAAMSLILAGAAGNIIDSLVYGLIFSKSTIFKVASSFPADGGYTTFMQGKVVDMLYFPLFYLPEWVPVMGGHKFFPYIFNVADAAITIGVFIIVIWQKKFFVEEK
ncbi:MAG: lipoprotein signal peptidase, partial [Chitinophagales bacterium]